MTFDIVTIFPRMVDALLEEGILARAVARRLVEVEVHDLRAFADDPHRVVDDSPFGGGPGMVLKPEPIFRAVESIRRGRGTPSAIVLMSPQGKPLTQADVQRFGELEHIVVLCGRYEGVDERVRELLVTDEVSIGDYVLSGGELPALVLLDAVGRVTPGAVGDARSVVEDSFSSGLLDHPHYTRPAEFRGMAVPEILLSGHHARIARWRRQEALRRTLDRRPDLIESAELDAEQRSWLGELRHERAEGVVR